MPPVVSETTEELLLRLQSVLEQRAPEVLRSLQPGLSKDQISALEAQGGFTLSSDLRTLYQWRNGSKISDSMLFIPGHRFLPLEEIVAERTALRSQEQAASFAQRVIYAVFAGHRKTWIHILDDGAGDGYFHDPNRSGASGEFFYNLGEARYFVFFPSLRNFLKGAIEGYEQDAFIVNDAGKSLEEDDERATKIWHSLGFSNAE